MPCATTLLQLLDDCRPTLDIMLDMNDGTRDGVAGQLDELRAQCLAIPSAEVVAELKTMHDAGMCSNAMLDGVARTEVGAAPCVDVNTHCDILIAGGIDCGEQEMITGCRATCGTCDDDGGGKRRAQITSSCPLKDFDTQASAVNDACCDDDDCQGVPTACDAKCAVVFDGFFDRCSSILGLQMADQMPDFTSLHATCSTQLPVEPLLRAVIACEIQDSRSLSQNCFKELAESTGCSGRNEISDTTTPSTWVQSRAMCEELCRLDSTCVSYEWADVNPGSPTDLCHLSTTCVAEYSSTISQYPTSQWKLYLKTYSSACESPAPHAVVRANTCCTVLEETANCHGGVIGRSGVPTAGACCGLCGLDDRCGAWAWINRVDENKQCYLKSSCSSITHDNDGTDYFGDMSCQ